jgi:cytochrome c
VRTALLIGVLVMAAGAASARGASGDVKAGQDIYERCAGCHAIDRDRAGPRHCGIVGRRAGSLKGYEYSEALRRSNIVWTEASLDRFLASPMQAVPGTSMGYAGIDSAAERADLIAYLKFAGDRRRCASAPQASEK